jgi:hypothetical protein
MREEEDMMRHEAWVIRLFQVSMLLIFVSGFVFFQWALLIWYFLVLYMTFGWMRIDNWMGHNRNVQLVKRKDAAE